MTEYLDHRSGKPIDVLERIADKFLAGDDCWEWIGTRNDQGYGIIGLGGTRYRAHRIVYEALVGLIPEGLQIDHLCRNRGCVRPDHLEPVTQRDNILRGEGSSAQHARQTHCKWGHPFDEKNTLYLERRGGERFCRACNNRRQKETQHKKRELAAA